MKNTIYDIAKKAHLSPAAISLALRDSPEISEKTREKVKAIARKMNYTPNSLARALVMNKTNTLGVVVHEVNSPFLSDIFIGMQEEANNRGYMVIFNSISSSRENAVRMFLGKQVDGLMILPTTKTNDDIELLIESKFPFVFFNRRIPDARIDYVTCDNVKGGYDMASHLISLGHRNIAYITGLPVNSAIRERLEGFKKAFSDNNLPAADDLVFLTRDEQTDLPEIIPRILASTKKPTAIFTGGDVMAMRVIKYLKEENIRVPQDIAVTGFNNLSYSELCDPPLTTMDHFGYKMGAKSVEILLNKIHGASDDKNNVQRVIIEPKLVIRKSCGAYLKTCPPNKGEKS